MKFAIPAALCGALALAACQTTGGAPDPNAVMADALAYACPIAAGIQVSALKLNAAQQAIVATAVADCQIWEANPSASFTSPTAVASILVQAAVLIQQSGLFKAMPHDRQARFLHGVAELKALRAQ